MLSVFDQYLYDNPSQHTYCKSHNSEFVILVKHALQTNADITEFPTIWAVLSILLDTQNSPLEYVQYFQHTYNRYYKVKPDKHLEKLETKCIVIQNCMFDSITDDFDSVSHYDDNGPTPLQGQQDEQSQAVNAVHKTIDSDENDINTSYPKWSTYTYDIIDTSDIDNRKRQEIQGQISKDTPVKTRDNKPYIDNVNAHNKDRALINISLSDRLDSGCKSLLGAQQIAIIGKHNDQRTHVLNYLRQLRLGENARNIYSDVQGRKAYTIPQVDGIVDSNTSSSLTTDSMDLTVSPLKRNTKVTDKHKRKTDPSDDDIDESLTENQRQTRKSRKNKGVGKASARANAKKAKSTELNDKLQKIKK